MSQYYKSLHEVPNTGGHVVIYQVVGSKKGNWTVRIKRQNAAGYFVKSLKTTDVHEAYTRANMHYLNVRQAEDRKIVLEPAATFRVLANQYLDDKKESSPTAWRTIAYQFSNYYVPYFGARNVQGISQQQYIRYLNDYRLLNSKRKAPTINTLNVEQQNLKSFLAWCYRKGKISQPIYMGRISKNLDWIENDKERYVDYDKPQRRDMATYEAYRLWRDYTAYVPVIRHGRGETVEVPWHFVSRMRMNFYMKTMFNLVCRPGEELLEARWRDMQLIESVEADGGLYVKYTALHGKKVKRKRQPQVRSLEYVSTYEYPGMLAAWMELLRTHGYSLEADSYIFPINKEGTKNLNSQNACAYIRRNRENVIEWARGNDQLPYGREDQLRSFVLYNIRHAAIKRLITESRYNFSLAAERANTSISMLQDFYHKYMEKPEGRLVSKDPSPDAHKVKIYSEETAHTLASVLTVIPSKKKKRR